MIQLMLPALITVQRAGSSERVVACSLQLLRRGAFRLHAPALSVREAQWHFATGCGPALAAARPAGPALGSRVRRRTARGPTGVKITVGSSG